MSIIRKESKPTIHTFRNDVNSITIFLLREMLMIAKGNVAYEAVLTGIPQL